MRRWITPVAVCLLLALIVGAHVALWQSERMPDETKLRLTVINAIGWAVVLLPAVGVALWRRAHRGR